METDQLNLSHGRGRSSRNMSTQSTSLAPKRVYKKRRASKQSLEKKLNQRKKDKHWRAYKKETRKAENEFKRMEDVFTSMRLQLVRDKPHSVMLEEMIRLEVKEVLIPIHSYLVKLLSQYAYTAECDASQEALQQEINSEVIGEPISKKKKRKQW